MSEGAWHQKGAEGPVYLPDIFINISGRVFCFFFLASASAWCVFAYLHKH